MTSKQKLLVVVAKEPVAGRCKTRLAQTIGFAEAARLYEGFLMDLRERLPRDAGPDVAMRILYEPASDPAYFRHFTEPVGWSSGVQLGSDLGQRLRTAIMQGLQEGYGAVVVMSSDSPDVPAECLREAFARLEDHDVVIGPCLDGGYYLIGARADFPRLFEDIAWSTDQVFQQTLQRARECGAMVGILPDWYDMDTASDVQKLFVQPEAQWPWVRGDRPGAIPETRRRAGQIGLHVSSDSEMDAAPPIPLYDRRFETLASRDVYRNPWTSVREDRVRLPNGRETPYGVVTFGECVGVLPILDDGRILLIRQFRYVSDSFFWEMPTGGVHAGEQPLRAAIRELREETGQTTETMVPLQSFHTSKSVCRETAHLFVARHLMEAPLEPDETEFFLVRAFSVDVVVRMVQQGEIMDSMTVVAVYAALQAGYLKQQ